MTTNHARAVWQYGQYSTLGTKAVKLDYGRRRSKDYVFANVDDLINNPFGTVGIRPYVYGPNTYSADQWGVSFPAGLVMVLTSFGTHGSGDFATRLQSWLDNSMSGSNNGVMQMVPGVLPAGYTANLTTPWIVSQTNYFNAAQALNYVPSATGWTAQAWRPSNAPNGVLFSTNMGSLSIPVAGDGYGIYSVLATGYRNVGIRMIYPCASPVVFTPGSATMTVTFSHNADGSNPGNADGGVTDGTASFVDSDFVYNAGLGGMAGPIVNAGAALATRGTLTNFQMHVHTAFAGGLVAFNIYVYLSPRMDVPFPLTVTGEADLIAPGGTP